MLNTINSCFAIAGAKRTSKLYVDAFPSYAYIYAFRIKIQSELSVDRSTIHTLFEMCAMNVYIQGPFTDSFCISSKN